MNWERAVAVALVVGLIGPLFWLGVNYLKNKAKALLRKQIAKRQARGSARDLRRP